MTPCIWLGTTHPCNPPNYGLWINLLFFMMCTYKHCFPPMLLVFAMKCCTKMPCPLPHNHYCCLLSSLICLPHLHICTCLISSPIACPSSSMLCWCLLRSFFYIYVTFLCDSILDYLCTYFCLIDFFIPFHFGCVFMCVSFVCVRMIHILDKTHSGWWDLILARSQVCPRKRPKKSQTAKRKFLGQQVSFGTKFLKFDPKKGQPGNPATVPCRLFIQGIPRDRVWIKVFFIFSTTEQKWSKSLFLTPVPAPGFIKNLRSNSCLH